MKYIIQCYLNQLKDLQKVEKFRVFLNVILIPIPCPPKVSQLFFQYELVHCIKILYQMLLY